MKRLKSTKTALKSRAEAEGSEGEEEGSGEGEEEGSSAAEEEGSSEGERTKRQKTRR